MKSKGQTLVMFVILIPLIIMFAAFIVDTGLIYKETAHLRGVTKDIIMSETNNIEVVKNLYKENDIDTSNLEVVFGNGMRIKNEYEIDSIFGNIVGFNSYKIKIDISGYIDNGEWKFEE